MEPGKRFKFGLDVGVGFDALARRRCELRKHDAPAIFGKVLEELAEGAEFLRQTLGVVQPVYADNAIVRVRSFRFDAG